MGQLRQNLAFASAGVDSALGLEGLSADVIATTREQELDVRDIAGFARMRRS
jgi:hypothetical protein